MNKLYVVTSNKNKFLTLKEKLRDLSIHIEHSDINLIEPQSNSIQEIALFKATQAFKTLKQPVLVHDSGLTINALKDFPGPYTKYVSDTIGNKGILNLLKDNANRLAYLTQTFCYADNQQVLCFSDKVRGHILYDAQPNTKTHNKWGNIWDIFAPGDQTISRSNMTDGEYFKLRPSIQTGSAWDELYAFLKNLT